MAATDRISPLLQPPPVAIARASAHELLASSSREASSARQLGTVLGAALAAERSRLEALDGQLATSNRVQDDLLATARDQLKTVRLRATNLRERTANLHTEAEELRRSLAGPLDAPPSAAPDAAEPGQHQTLRETLLALSDRRRRLERAKQWSTTIAKAEALGTRVLESLEQNLLPQAFRAYVGLVDYVKLVHSEVATAPRHPGQGGNGMIGLTSHLVGIANSVWNSLVKVLSTRLLSKLEALGWPTPFPEPLDPFEDEKVAQFQTAFVDLLTLELLHNNNVLPTSTSATSSNSKRSKPLLALVPLVHPLLLRFKWQFEGDRSTNRIDKPEYPLSHVLNLLTSHERFLTEDVQYLLSTNGFDHLDALNEFTTLLLNPLAQRLRHHVPQLVQLPPVLAHTIYQVVEFDQVLRSRGYTGPRKSGTSEVDVVAAAAAAAAAAATRDGDDDDETEWQGLSHVILGRREWFEKWLDGEREFFDKRYYSAISHADAWHVVPPEDYDASASPSGTRPTESALRVKLLSEQLADRYRPLPLRHTVPFVLTLHLPLLVGYAKRIQSSLDAFESLGFGGLLPGALGQTTAATQGVGGVVRLIRAGVSARWMSERCEEWGEDAFFLHLYEYLEQVLSQGKIDDPDHNTLAEEVVENSNGTLFDRERKTFQDLADRSEDLIVRHCTREVVAELKPYFSKRFDAEPLQAGDDDSDARADDRDVSLSPELVPALSVLSSLLSSLVASYPPSTVQSLYRRIARHLSQTLYDRVFVANAWTERVAQTTLTHDFEQGFLAAASEAGIPRRGIERGWELARASIRFVALPTTTTSQGEESRYEPGAKWTFSKVMKVVWDEDDDEDDDENGGQGVYEGMLEALGVGDECLTRRQVKTLLRQRPECWR